MRIRVLEQGCRLHLANFTKVAVNISGVINNPIGCLRLEVRFADKHHGVKRLALDRLPEEEKVAGPRGAQVA